MVKEKQYIAIDLKSFYASVECTERGLDPLDANLVVADESRTDKTICLAVSPALKALGIPGRPRLFEVRQKVQEINQRRRSRAPGREFRGKSASASELHADPSLELDFIVATPRMRYYMEYSRNIVKVYMRYVSMDDILIYSVDEVFIDATPYLGVCGLSAHDFAMKMIRDVLSETRITATAGIGTNMYLAKVAMDVVAKRMPADRDGVRIAQLDERSYREQLWCHRPITDFWRVGRGIARSLERNGMYTMGDVARCSEGGENELHNENLLYRLFGINAELLIDHAWGWEPARIADCKAYVPESKSLSQGQVLTRPYRADEGRIVVREMADQLSMDLVRKGLLCDQVVLDVGYDIENLNDPGRAERYTGPVSTDHYGRRVPRRVHGSQNLGHLTASTKRICDAVCEIYDRIVDPQLMVRRFNISVVHLITEAQASVRDIPEQLDLFSEEENDDQEAREKRMQQALLDIREKYGKNAIVKGLNLKEGATAMERNRQIGGHKA